MANTKVADLAALTTPADTDLVVTVDTSDTSMSSNGTSTKMTTANLLGGATQAEMGYFAGLNSKAQTQLDAIGAASGTFTNTTGNAITDGVTATTQSSSDGSTKIATTAYVDAAGGGGGGGDVTECTGRITGYTGEYVQSTVVVWPAEINTIYYCGPTGGKFRTWLWGGSAYAEMVYDQISLPLAGLGGVIDVFVYNNGGIPTLSSVAWSNTTTRTSALVMDSLGILHKNGDQAHRYLGTVYVHTVGVGGDQTDNNSSIRHIWNYYNRAPHALIASPETLNEYWTYSTNTMRAANTNTTLGEFRVSWVQGLANVEPVELKVYGIGYWAPNDLNYKRGVVGIGIDSTSVDSSDLNSSADLYYAYQRRSANLEARYIGHPGLGAHYGQWLENSPDGYDIVFHGSDTTVTGPGAASIYQCGIIGRIWC